MYIDTCIYFVTQIQKKDCMGEEIHEQSKRRINILGVKRELLHPKQEREQNIQYHPHLCLL